MAACHPDNRQSLLAPLESRLPLYRAVQRCDSRVSAIDSTTALITSLFTLNEVQLEGAETVKRIDCVPEAKDQHLLRLRSALHFVYLLLPHFLCSDHPEEEDWK